MRQTISTIAKRTAMSTAIVGALAAGSLAHAKHGNDSSYHVWVDVMHVQPRYVEHYVDETVERAEALLR